MSICVIPHKTIQDFRLRLDALAALGTEGWIFVGATFMPSHLNVGKGGKRNLVMA